jgi:hypothetical protein
MKPFWLRAVMTIGLPFLVVYSFFSSLLREQFRTFRLACLEARAEIEAYHRLMREDDA